MQQLKDLLLQRRRVFAYSMKDLIGYKGPPVAFKMAPGARSYSKPRNYSALEKKVREEKFGELRDAGFIIPRDSKSDFASCPTFPAKKDEHGEWTDFRACIDYRGPNDLMVFDHYQLPLPEDIFRSLHGAKVMSKLDLRSGFSQLPLHPDSQEVTAFWWGQELWQYTRLPFGIRVSPSVFQKIMDEVLKQAGLTHCAKVFIDDVVVYSSTMEEHLQHVAAVLDALDAVDLRVHPAKSVFATERVEYLGHLVTPEGLEPVAAKTAAMARLKRPKSVKELQGALGLLNYYRCYIPQFSHIAKPLYELTRKGVEYCWTEEHTAAFDALKAELCTPGKVLRRPRSDRQFILHTDWSTNGIGAVLGQLDDDGNEFMVACVSRSLNKHERNYEPWKGELLAAVWGIKSFRVYLHGNHFELVTDHRPLLWLLTATEPTGQQARWVLSLQEYEFTIRHRPGLSHTNADVPSRDPCPSTTDVTGARLNSESDGYTGPLPQVVFGPVGTGSPLQVRKASEISGGGEHPVSMAAYINGVVVGEPYISNFGRAAMTASITHCHWDESSTIQSPCAYLASIVAASDRLSADYQYLLLQQAAKPDLFVQDSQLSVWETACGGELGPPPDVTAGSQRAGQERLRADATLWVTSVVKEGARDPAAMDGQPGLYAGPTQCPAVKHTHALCTLPINSTYFTAAQAGIVLYEPFGGICAGLEMVLRGGTPVHTYIYSDVDPIARRVATHRMAQLHGWYPELLPASAIQSAFSWLPQDVYQVTPSQLLQLAKALPRQWLVVAGWECQDLSPAGSNRGLRGNKSSTFWPLLQIVGTLQQVQPQLPPAYLIENTAFQHNWKDPLISSGDFEVVCSALGQPVCLDAAQFNSFAHRLRNFWTNLCSPVQLQRATGYAQRQEGLQVQQILMPGRRPADVRTAEQFPYYPCNKPGQPLSALPTIVSYPNSRAFREGRQGAVQTISTGQWSDLLAIECELAMGYSAGTTAAPGMSEQARRSIIGKCMDSNTLAAIYATAAAWFRVRNWQQPVHPVQVSIAESSATSTAPTCSPGLASGLATVQCAPTASQQYYSNMVLSALAEDSDVSKAPPAKVPDTSSPAAQSSYEVWQDQSMLHFLKEKSYMPGTSHADRTRVRKRAAFYMLAVDGRLLRKMADGSVREVPRPEERAAIIQQYHENCGHYGVRRTVALVATSFWWPGMWAQVAAAVGHCQLCSRARVSFNAKHPTLHPLPIHGLFYRWGVDLAGPFGSEEAKKDPHRYKYVMVAIEHFTKHIELVPLRNKEPATTAAAFAHHVLGRFGSPAEVLTDCGTEWNDDFADLLATALIDHRFTSPGHPETDGLAERAVQTVKRALRKLCAAKGTQDNWHMELPWLALGYRCSPQQSTGFSPYQLMYARTPVIPPAIAPRWTEVDLQLGNEEAAADAYLSRAELLKRQCVMAMGNLEIAQHRDTKRYERIRRGDYTPKIRRFEVGDYVYHQREVKSTLDLKAKPLILRVVQVKPNGVLELVGSCGTTVKVHSTTCAPCHLPNIDPHIEWRLSTQPQPCSICHSDGDAEYMVCCESCGVACHCYCALPPMDRVPDDPWICIDCTSKGVTWDSLLVRRKAEHDRAVQQLRPDNATANQHKAASLHGRLVLKTFHIPVADVAAGGARRRAGRGRRGPSPSQATAKFWGRITFRGGAGYSRQGQLLVIYEDGDSETVPYQRLLGLGKYTSVVPKEFELLPLGTQLPEGKRIPTLEELMVQDPQVVASTVTVLSSSSTIGVNLPDHWDLSKAATVAHALRQLMPGQHALGHITHIANEYQRYASVCLTPGSKLVDHVPTTAPEVDVLRKLVDLSGCSTVLDPFAGTGSIATVLSEHGVSVLSNDWYPGWRNVTYHCDALQPGVLRSFKAQVVVCSPPFSLLDVAVPLCARSAAVVACLHVPGQWITNATPPRQKWLDDLVRAGRLLVLVGLPRGPAGRKCAWLLVFANVNVKKAMLRVDVGNSSLTFAHGLPAITCADQQGSLQQMLMAHL